MFNNCTFGTINGGIKGKPSMLSSSTDEIFFFNFENSENSEDNDHDSPFIPPLIVPNVQLLKCTAINVVYHYSKLFFTISLSLLSFEISYETAPAIFSFILIECSTITLILTLEYHYR